ncbi:NAD(P)(+)--arginine ADP-ribosyltransferase 2-like [Carassius auratus]|uniref:NAD(P)(+)--arginine ADP-ribosyltransferase n=1 Tax=Carassius auratus TaxID=7957 RepID=A0A6P6MHX2_CARAU|nr:NAD(P)(+)--arginine ADP-ribosyltransferase 2-like [Carassius auratus]XP_026096053.1 NAD(P)(+)--arginine ADP-ribosyltransferase 2-like [Carassius auratus]
MLLIIEALLLISAAQGKDHRAATEEEIVPLDMALNSVDDQYEGCREKMADLVQNEYLEKELKILKNFKEAFEEGNNKFYRSWFGKLRKIHKIAIYAYTFNKIGLNNLNIHVKFNRDTRCNKQNYPVMKYEWYSLHFLLTEAIQILKKTQNRCFKTFRGTELAFDQDVENKEVRFGSFTSSSLDPNKANKFGTLSCFEIHTCEGADISNYSMLPSEKEVLIPPYEKFIVTGIRKRKSKKNDECKTVFVLESTGIRSDLNCVLFNQPKP